MINKVMIKNRSNTSPIDGKSLFLGVVALGAALFIFFGAPQLFSVNYSISGEAAVANLAQEIKKEVLPAVTHLPTPTPLKALYMTSWVAGTRDFRDSLIKLVEETELNAVIIDIKDYTGKISFEVSDKSLREIDSWEERILDIRDFIKYLHDKDIYVIGRISVFQDPYLASLWPDTSVKRASDGALWKDYKGLSFTDPGTKKVWEYHVAIGREAYNVGFDELNFDYVRFPSDGDMRDIYYPFSEERVVADPDYGKAVVLEEFFAYLAKALRTTDEAGDRNAVPVLSADLFGMTTTNTDDLNIGQVLERALPYFDYIMPMVYPSHYPSGFNGYMRPATMPYEVVKFSMDEAVERVHTLQSASTTPLSVRDHVSVDQLRPWLQDFDLGANYTPEMVRAQMQATYDAGLTSWALWDASNTYTRSALLEE